MGFNAGDGAFWSDRDRYIRFNASCPRDWPSRFAEIVETRGITDLVLYGDVRPIHASALWRSLGRAGSRSMCSRRAICVPIG